MTTEFDQRVIERLIDASPQLGGDQRRNDVHGQLKHTSPAASHAFVREASNRRRFATFLLALALTFIVGDMFLARIPFPQVYGSTNEIGWKWNLLQDAPRTPDVLILGSSFEAYGVSPRVIDRAIAEESGLANFSLNTSASASSAYTQRLFIERMLTAEIHPRIVYLGVTPHAVDHARESWMTNGLYSLGNWKHLSDARQISAEAARITVFTGLFDSFHRWNDCRLMVQRFLLGAPVNPKRDWQEDERGWLAWQGSSRKRRNVSTFGPGAEEQSRLNERYRPNTLNSQSLKASIQDLRGAGVDVRLLELPHSSYASWTADPGRNEPYQELIETIAAEASVPVVRPPAGLLTDEDYFDAGHLAPVGAQKVSRWLGAYTVAILEHPTTHLATVK